MLSARNGVNGARPRVRVKRTSNRVLRACLVSSSPNSPFRRFRLNLIYQFVVVSMRLSNRGTTVYSRYPILCQLSRLIQSIESKLTNHFFVHKLE